MWIYLRQPQNIIKKGEMHRYLAGEWVDVGRQMAEEWIAAGIAYESNPSNLSESIDPTAGIAVRGELSDGWRKKLNEVENLSLAFYDEPWSFEIPFSETLIWQTKPAVLRLDLMKVGFSLLKKWQVAVPLLDYTTLAANIGTTKDREKTKEVIRDLRVLVRDTRLIFVRRCDDTRELLSVWKQKSGEVSDERLAFLQALYIVKPIVCDLPSSWLSS